MPSIGASSSSKEKPIVSATATLPKAESTSKPLKMDDKPDLAQMTIWLEQIATNRDKQAFTCLFKFFAPKITGICSQKYNNPQLAVEILQETMTNVWRKAHLFHSEKGAPTTWIYSIMRNVSFDLLRKIQAKKEDNLSDDIWPMIENEQVEEQEFTDHLEHQHLMAHIDKLPIAQQQVIKGVYFQELSQEQLSQHLNIPLGTIKSRLRLALAKLKQHIGAHHD